MLACFERLGRGGKFVRSTSISLALLATVSMASAEGAEEGAPEAPKVVAPPTDVCTTSPPPPPETRTVDVRYGWQTLAFDGAALAMGLLETTSSSLRFLGPAAVGTYLAAAPVVHLHHGHLDRAAGSLGLRVGMPLLGAFIGAGMAGANSGPNTIESGVSSMAGAAIGMTVGIAGASLLDAFFLAREEKVEVIEPRTGMVQSWSPTVGVGPHGGAIGIQGTLF